MIGEINVYIGKNTFNITSLIDKIRTNDGINIGNKNIDAINIINGFLNVVIEVCDLSVVFVISIVIGSGAVDISIFSVVRGTYVSIEFFQISVFSFLFLD